MSQSSPNKTNTKLADSVLQRITEERVCPKSRLWCWIEELSVWALWLVTVFVGALAVAVICYSINHGMYGFYEATHPSKLALWLDIMPYVWIVVFVAMAGLAYRNLRHTKRGYRYPFWQILVSSLVVSVVLGMILHAAGLGKLTDSMLADHMPLYISQEESELSLWQQPAEGRLVGAYTRTAYSADPTFVDVTGTTWQVDMMELTMMDMNELETGEQVRILGVQTGTSTMHVCGVFPWMFGAAVAVDDMEYQRQEFVSRMYAHKDRAVERLEALTEESRSEDMDSICHTLPVIERISESMQ